VGPDRIVGIPENGYPPDSRGHGATWRVARDLSREPSEYFKRQCFVSVECDEEPVKGVFDLIGVANIVFSTDFPHPDCKYPGAVAQFLELPLPDAAKRAILWDNCARYYGLA
jgi:predicted TIM-barrel fold metal-dependent hydrolase